MFADVAPEEAAGPLGWFTNPWVSTGIILFILFILGGLVWWLTRGDNLAVVRGFVAGRVRRLLMRRRSASPTPPRMQSPEARTPTPAPKREAATPPKGERPASTDAPTEEAPAWITKALVVIASVPTLLALPWAAYSVAQLLPIPLAVALPLGVLFDVAMVGAVLVALLVPSVSRQASVLGWVAAAAAAVAIAVHVGVSGALIFASTPLISKALWGLLIVIRRQQASLRASRVEAERLQGEADEEAALLKEEKDAEARATREDEEARLAAELSTDLEHERLAVIAQLERDAVYEERVAAAKLKVKLARSHAEHLEALAEIERIGDQRVAENTQSARVWEQEIRLGQRLSALRGDRPSFLAVESGVSEDGLVAEVSASAAGPKAGFGGGFGFSRPLDVKDLTPVGATVAFEDLSEEHQQLVKYVHVDKKATVRGAALKFERDPRTIRRWKEDLAEYGYTLPIGK